MSGISADCPSSAPPAAERLGRLRTALDRGCRYLLAAVFLMAALTKVTDLCAFEDRVALRSPLPVTMAVALARFLPWLELTCGVCLLLGRAVREAALLAAVLLVGFLVHELLATGGAECGCLLFPGSEQFGTPAWLVGRNLLLLACAARVTWRPGPVRGAGPVLPDNLEKFR